MTTSTRPPASTGPASTGPASTGTGAAARPGAPSRRPRLRLRDVVLAAGLVGIVLCGTATIARAAADDASGVPGAVLAALGLVAVAAVLVRAAARHRRRAAAAKAPADPVDYDAMDPNAFELAVAELCARDGCVDVEVVGGAGDLGADVVATAPDGRRVVLQCKHYGPGNKVGSQDLQRFGGTCFAVHEADVAALVTSSDFTEPAAEYAAQCGIVCCDRAALDAWTEGTGPAPWSPGR
ncbi:restriction endonuclease [Streptomyces sp. NPDC045431]|uniref:restriction endonuclease n=1 Tax=Streptomyces sp. NPDC045431 TaxID=3155613 RepID=UPI0033E0DD43